MRVVPWKSSAGRRVFESVVLAGLRRKTGVCTLARRIEIVRKTNPSEIESGLPEVQ